MRPGAAPAGPGALALRRLRRDRWALAWGGLFLIVVVLASAIVDIITALLDPRLRRSGLRT